MEDLSTTIRSVLEAEQETIRAMHEHAVADDPSGEPPAVDETITETYDGYNVDVRVRLRYTGDPHRYDIRKGHFAIRIEGDLEDTEILTSVKPYFYDVFEELMPTIEPHVTQDYPTGTLKISKDIKTDEVEEWFL